MYRKISKLLRRFNNILEQRQASANRALGEVKGRAASIPNQDILIDTLVLQEACSSSEIENIVTRQDELFRADSGPQVSDSPEAKAVLRYRVAFKEGYQLLQKHGNITNETLITMYRRIKLADDRFRKKPVYIGNPAMQEIICTPPKDPAEIQELMNGLERFINDDAMSVLDPLIKMALIHYQFESIHPFSDGNGRVGRILNMLYLTKSKLLDNPILYPSRMIAQTKERYYRLFTEVREQEAWHEWVAYMLGIVEQSAHSSLHMVSRIRELMAEYENRIRGQFGSYSQDLLNNLFRHPYSRVAHLNMTSESRG